MAIVYKKKTKKRKRTHGFRKRMKTKQGKRILSRKRRKKRSKIAV